MAYSVKALAEKWECSPKHIYNLIHRGHLKSFSIGLRRGTRITDKEVERWEESGENLAGAEMAASEGKKDYELPTNAISALARIRR